MCTNEKLCQHVLDAIDKRAPEYGGFTGLDREAFGGMKAQLEYMRTTTERRMSGVESQLISTNKALVAAIAEQTKADAWIHRRISGVKYLTLGVLAIGTAIGSGLDWFLEQITKLGN